MKEFDYQWFYKLNSNLADHYAIFSLGRPIGTKAYLVANNGYHGLLLRDNTWCMSLI